MSAPFATLSYSLPDAFPAHFWRPGLRLLVPVGRALRAAILLATTPVNPLPEHIICRPVLFPMETRPSINSGLFAMLTDLAARQGITPGNAFGHTLPQGLRSPDFTVRGKSKIYESKDLAYLSSAEYTSLASDLLAGEAIFARNKRDMAELEMWSLAIDPPWPLRPAATRQIAVLDYLHEQGTATRAALLKISGSGSVLQKLAEPGYIVMRQKDEPEADSPLLPPREAPFQLNQDQQAALADLKDALLSSEAETRLLYGVTGSGKTAVYIELARSCMEAGKPCILLAPEVALAHKLHRDARDALPGVAIFLYHGYQHPLQREKLFRQIADLKGPYVIVGTRSALFLPFEPPGCIILDEEHDGSYKQDENIPYHAKELAWQRARTARGLLVLGSATPDIRTFQASSSGALGKLTLPMRINQRPLPPLEIVPMDKRAGFSATPEDPGLLADTCEQALLECLKNNEQAIILLNRRGYAPLIHCLDCNQTLKCPNCQIGLAFHKSAGRLVCHYCGHTAPWPAPCWHCGGANYIPIGEGTERIAERLETLAGQPILRLDRDSARRPGRIEEILTGFGAGQSPFLVGTQMLSKGHHFPNVTLVIAADGDIGLNLPDYRAAERTFQLLAQSAGRAGRGIKPGRAMVQTRNPLHYCWEHLKTYNYEGFYEDELARRLKYCYPPFIRIGLIRLSWPMNDTGTEQAAHELGSYLKQAGRNMDLALLGPAPAPMPYLKGRKRMHCLLKAKDWQPMRELWFLAQKHKAAKKIRIFLDLDPVDML